MGAQQLGQPFRVFGCQAERPALVSGQVHLLGGVPAQVVGVVDLVPAEGLDLGPREDLAIAVDDAQVEALLVLVEAVDRALPVRAQEVDALPCSRDRNPCAPGDRRSQVDERRGGGAPGGLEVGGVDQEGNAEDLFPERSLVSDAPMLVEALAVVAGEEEGRALPAVELPQALHPAPELEVQGRDALAIDVDQARGDAVAIDLGSPSGLPVGLDEIAVGLLPRLVLTHAVGLVDPIRVDEEERGPPVP